MNRLLKNALKALKKHYSRILLINRKLDSYYPVVIEENESKWHTMGRLTDFAHWFSENGNIYESDKPLFRQYVQDCFINGENRYLFYRRKSGSGYRWAYIFIEKGDDPDKPDEEYLYVRDCNEVYVEQCDLILDNVGYVDALTGLKNRLAFNADQQSGDKINFVTVVNLETINEQDGYDAGNEVIAKVASILEEFTENAYRITGSKFALLNAGNLQNLQIALNGLAIIE